MVFEVLNDGTLFHCNMITVLHIPGLRKHYVTTVAPNIRT